VADVLASSWPALAVVYRSTDLLATPTQRRPLRECHRHLHDSPSLPYNQCVLDIIWSMTTMRITPSRRQGESRWRSIRTLVKFRPRTSRSVVAEDVSCRRQCAITDRRGIPRPPGRLPLESSPQRGGPGLSNTTTKTESRTRKRLASIASGSAPAAPDHSTTRTIPSCEIVERPATVSTSYASRVWRAVDPTASSTLSTNWDRVLVFWSGAVRR